MSYTILNPADESVVTTVEHLGADETDEAIAAAVVAQRAWATVAPPIGPQRSAASPRPSTATASTSHRSR